MRTRLTLATLAVAACSGSDVTSPPASCDTIEADLISQVDQGDWPPGVDGIVGESGLYRRMQGTWSADNSCGDDVTVKFTAQPEDTLQIVTKDWPAFPGFACGCTVDPAWPPDPMFDLVMLVSNWEVYVEGFSDPGVDRQNVVTEGAFYVPEQPLTFRTCGQRNIDPLVGSDYSSAAYAVRVVPNEVLQLTITLTDDFGAKQICDLDNFDFIVGN
jgi:hypothetical protein